MRRSIPSAVLLVATLAGASPPAASQDCAPTLLGADRRGAERSIARVGDTVYLVAGAALEVMDVTAPEAPILLGWINLDQMPRQVLASGSLAVLRHRRSLELVSVAEPSAPLVTGTFPFPVSWNVTRAAMSSGIVLLAAQDAGLRIIDVTDASQPTEIAAWTEHGVTSVAASGGYAYLSTSNGLRIFDVQDPGNPVQVNVVDGIGGSLDLSGNGRRLARSGHCGAPHEDCAVVRFLDLTDPTTPIERSRLDISGYNVSEVAMSGGRAFVLLDDHIEIFDLSSLANPVYLGAFWPGRPSDVVASGTHLYVADHFEGLLIASLAEPSAPEVVGRLPSAGSATGLHVVDHYAVTSFEAGVRVFDLANPARPLVAAELSAPEDWPYGVDGLVGTGRVAVVNAYQSHVEVVDLDDPSDPQFVASFGSLKQSAKAASGSSVLIQRPYSPNGVTLWDLSVPTAPLELGSLPVETGVSTTFTLSREWAFVAYGDYPYYVVRAFDVSDPTAPIHVGDLTDLLGEAMLTSDHHLWASDFEQLRLYDVADPSQMTVVSEIPIEVFPASLARSGSLVAASGWSSGFEGEVVLLDYSVTEQPIEIARFDAPGSAGSVAFAPGLLIVADGAAGVSVYSTCQPFADDFERGDTSAWSDVEP